MALDEDLANRVREQLAPHGAVTEKATVTTYLLPAVAIVLGALVRDERIALASVAGCALILAGAAIATRSRVRSGAA